MENEAQPQRPARPWDLFNKNLGRVQEQVAAERFSICQACPEYIKLTHQCKECGCIMNAKVKLPNASCPLHKWEAVQVSYKEDLTGE
jgi:ribosomal protein L32